eukprot:scaffold155613_cov45-Attheya_sp.AAC.1
MRLVLAVGMMVDLLQSDISYRVIPSFAPSLLHQAANGWGESMRLVQAVLPLGALLEFDDWLVVDIHTDNVCFDVCNRCVSFLQLEGRSIDYKPSIS